MATRIITTADDRREISKPVSIAGDHRDLELSLNALNLRKGSQSALFHLMALVMLLSHYYMRRFKRALSAPQHA